MQRLILSGRQPLPKLHSLCNSLSRDTPDRSGTFEVEGGPGHVLRPGIRRDQGVQLPGISIDDEEPVQVAPVGIQKTNFESLDGTALCLGAQVSHEFVEVLAAGILTAGNGTVPCKEDDVPVLTDSSWGWWCWAGLWGTF